MAMTMLRTALSDLTEQADGVLAVTTFQSLAIQWLAPRLGSFQLAHPRIAVRLDTEGRILDLNHDGFDVGIRSGSGEWPGLESVYLFPSTRTPLCTPQLRDALGGLARPADLVTAPLIGLEEEWAEWFTAAGVTATPLKKGGRLIADMQTIAVASALMGRGVALASPYLFAPEIAQGRLVQPFAAAGELSAGVWLTYPKDRRRVPKIAAFRDWLTALIADEARFGPQLP